MSIIKTLRKLGASVQPLHTVGNGCPDILVGIAGQNLLVEIKDGAKPPSARRLTPDQEVWHRDWRGAVVVVSTLDEAVILVGRYK